MIQSLTAVGFRCFREIRVEPLTRVNLFVGENNAGKTSLLEAVELVAVGGVEGLTRSAMRRGEKILVKSENGERFKDHIVDLAHLFFGHDLRVGSFEIRGHDQPDRWVKCKVRTYDTETWPGEALFFESHITEQQNLGQNLTLSPQGGVIAPPSRSLQQPKAKVQFVAADSIDPAHLDQPWSDLVLTSGEDEVIRSLQVIEPNLERLAFVGDLGGSRVPLVRLKGFGQRLHLGSLGGGLRHFLALVLNLLSAREGFLLVDEIDTGLHYSVMVDMWRLLAESAKRLDVQVFATTHSLDCVRALARLRKKQPEIAAEITVHRVEKGAQRTIAYDADEIVVAADSHIEVR